VSTTIPTLRLSNAGKGEVREQLLQAVESAVKDGIRVIAPNPSNPPSVAWPRECARPSYMLSAVLVAPGAMRSIVPCGCSRSEGNRVLQVIQLGVTVTSNEFV